MKTVQINIYKNKQKETVLIEVSDSITFKPAEVEKQASKALTPEQRSCLWDWEFVYNNS